MEQISVGRVYFHGIKPRLLRPPGSRLKAFLDVVDLRLIHLVGDFSADFGNGRRSPRPASAIKRASRSSPGVADLNGDFTPRLMNRLRETLQPRNMRVIVYTQHMLIQFALGFDGSIFDNIQANAAGRTLLVIGY